MNCPRIIRTMIIVGGLLCVPALALAQEISTTTPRVPLQETIGGQTKPEVVHTATVPHEPRGGHENPIVRYLT